MSKKLSLEEIENILFEEITDNHDARPKIQNGCLFIQKSLSGQWLNFGEVESESVAQSVIDAFFEGINY